MHEESRGRRGPSQQGQRSAARAAKGFFDRPQAAEDAVSVFHWNVVPVVHMRCRMTASLRATAMVAFLAPMRLPRASPQVFSALGRAAKQHFGGLEQKAAHHAVSALGDAPDMIDLAGLITPGRHPEVGRHRRRSLEPRWILDAGHIGQGNHRADARCRHQLAGSVVAASALNDGLVVHEELGPCCFQHQQRRLE